MQVLNTDSLCVFYERNQCGISFRLFDFDWVLTLQAIHQQPCRGGDKCHHLQSLMHGDILGLLPYLS